MPLPAITINNLPTKLTLEATDIAMASSESSREAEKATLLDIATSIMRVGVSAPTITISDTNDWVTDIGKCAMYISSGIWKYDTLYLAAESQPISLGDRVKVVITPSTDEPLFTIIGISSPTIATISPSGYGILTPNVEYNYRISKTGKYLNKRDTIDQARGNSFDAAAGPLSFFGIRSDTPGDTRVSKIQKLDTDNIYRRRDTIDERDLVVENLRVPLSTELRSLSLTVPTTGTGETDTISCELIVQQEEGGVSPYAGGKLQFNDADSSIEKNDDPGSKEAIKILNNQYIHLPRATMAKIDLTLATTGYELSTIETTLYFAKEEIYGDFSTPTSTSIKNNGEAGMFLLEGRVEIWNLEVTPLAAGKTIPSGTYIRFSPKYLLLDKPLIFYKQPYPFNQGESVPIGTTPSQQGRGYIELSFSTMIPITAGGTVSFSAQLKNVRNAVGVIGQWYKYRTFTYMSRGSSITLKRL